MLSLGEELLSGGLQLPASVEREDVSRIDIERAFFGFVDRCTANVSIESQASSELEVVVPCRWDRYPADLWFVRRPSPIRAPQLAGTIGAAAPALASTLVSPASGLPV